MTKLEQLIAELCPNGVEYIKIKYIAEIGTGSSNGNEAEDNGCYPFFIRSQTVKQKSEWEYDEEALIIPGEGGIGEIYHYINGKYAIHQRVYRIHFISDKVITKFAFYYFHSCFKAFILQKAVSATVKSIRKPMIEEFSIPLPPLPIQEEIVRILDNFTQLTAELTAELTARKKQYEHYRDTLLTFGDDVEWKTLGDVGTFTRGRRFVHADDRKNGIPCIHYGELYTYYGISATKVKTYINSELKTNFRYAKKNDVVIVAAGENKVDIGVGVAWLGDDLVAIHDACFIFSHKQNPKYISYFLQTKMYHKQIVKFVSEGKICSIPANGLSKAKIPIPPLSEQQRIVDILDRFDTLCNDISKGLPAEIKARQKQYEYYRDKLLTFEELKNDRIS